jgi:hypothetical protein
MTSKRPIRTEGAERLGATLGVDWTKIPVEPFRRGLKSSWSMVPTDPDTNVTDNVMTVTGKIVWAHLKEFPDCNTRLDKLEAEADAYWAKRR